MAGTASVAGDVFVDALPYFDQGYDATGVREAVSLVGKPGIRSGLAHVTELLLELWQNSLFVLDSFLL